MNTINRLGCLLVIGLLAGCGGQRVDSPNSGSAVTTAPAAGGRTRGVSADWLDAMPKPAPEQSRATPPALVMNQPVQWSELRPLLVEAGGGQVLAEVVIDRLLTQRLRSRGLKVSEAEIQRERTAMLQAIDPDPNQGTVLLEKVRKRRGLGDTRFQLLLRRNAGLRKLVADQASVSDVMVQLDYQFKYGRKYEVRMIQVANLSDAQQVKATLANGLPFAEAAMKLSLHESAARGGLLPPLSTVDPTIPKAVRDLLPTLAVEQVSDPIAMPDGFALFMLVRKVPARDVALDTVRQQLHDELKRRLEKKLMERESRIMIEQADVTVLDPTLNKLWKDQRQLMLELEKR